LIAYLSGRILEKHPNRVIVDVNGVGYDVAVPLSTFYSLGNADSNVTLRIHTHVREDALSLYGFLTALEQDLFERLIGVSGIGPKVALAVLSGIEPLELMRAIERADIARLTAIPGVGKKTSERIVLELKDRLPRAQVAAVGAGAALPVDPRTVDSNERINQTFVPATSREPSRTVPHRTASCEFLTIVSSPSSTSAPATRRAVRVLVSSAIVTMSSVPTRTPASSDGSAARCSPFCSTAIAERPPSVRHTFPRPPNTEVPPSTTAVIASSSYPVPASALAWPRCATYTIAAMLATTPESTYARPTRRATGRPAYRAPAAVNPIVYQARPTTDRCSSTT
jgi:Holliday junction DNA helicase RuvA